MLKRFFILSIVALTAMASAFAQQYVAGVKGTKEWTCSDFGPIAGYGVLIKNDVEKHIMLQVMAFRGGHFEVETSPMGIYLSGNGAVLISDTMLASFNVGGKSYKDVHYMKYKARMEGGFTNIELWQLVDSGIEYTIIALAPVKKNQLIKNFISDNLILLPLPEVTEDEFVRSIEEVNNLLLAVGGSKLSDEVKMTSAVVDREKKEFTRTYQFYPEVSAEDIDYMTSKDGTYSMIEYDVENTPFAKTAVELGYNLGVVWIDKNGEEIAAYIFEF